MPRRGRGRADDRSARALPVQPARICISRTTRAGESRSSRGRGSPRSAAGRRSAAARAAASRNEYAGLCAYAAERGITVVPEVDMPGHVNGARRASSLRPPGSRRRRTRAPRSASARSTSRARQSAASSRTCSGARRADAGAVPPHRRRRGRGEAREATSSSSSASATSSARSARRRSGGRRSPRQAWLGHGRPALEERGARPRGRAAGRSPDHVARAADVLRPQVRRCDATRNRLGGPSRCATRTSGIPERSWRA